MSATTWRGDDSNTPRVTAKVLRWYRLRLADWFRDMHGEIDSALLDGLAEWFAQRPDEFLIWKAEDVYRGGTYNLGCWRLDFAAMKPALGPAIREIEAEQRLRAYASLGPVTGADVDAAIARLEGEEPLTPEPEAETFFPGAGSPERSRYFDNLYRVQDHWPKPCRTCGDEFRPDRMNARTCTECRAAARLKRQETKQHP